MLIDVVAVTPTEIVFEGRARSVRLPGEEGVFEVLPFHNNMVSRLVYGILAIDDKIFHVRRGVMKVHLNHVTILFEREVD